LGIWENANEERRMKAVARILYMNWIFNRPMYKNVVIELIKLKRIIKTLIPLKS